MVVLISTISAALLVLIGQGVQQDLRLIMQHRFFNVWAFIGWWLSCRENAVFVEADAYLFCVYVEVLCCRYSF